MDLELFDQGFSRPCMSDVIEHQLDKLMLCAGDVVVMCVANRNIDAIVTLMLVNRSIRLLMMPDASQDSERARYGQEVGARGIVSVTEHEIHFQALTSGPKESRVTEPGIYLLTSGSTGTPKVVFRTIDSWHAEAQRFIRLLDLGKHHRVLLAAPIHHAYILGWLWAAWTAGAEIALADPKELGQISSKLMSWATHAALTPNIARLLAMRRRSQVQNSNLQVVMTGAGPVSEALDQQFVDAFAIRLSTNYGSTETGALFAGLAPVPPYSMGQPMPGVRVIADPDRETFPLQIELESDERFDTGDIISLNNGVYRIVGRQSIAIRRGERWISPLEIEAAIQQLDWVADCYVRGVESGEFGNDRIIASVVPVPEDSNQKVRYSEAILLDYCGTKLSRHKIPDVVDFVSHIERDDKGKPRAYPKYQCADRKTLLETANAYKRSHLLFALFDVGVLQMVDDGLSADQIALRLGVRPSVLATALRVASHGGIVSRRDKPGGHSQTLNQDVENLIRLEMENNRGFNSAANLASLIGKGEASSSEQRPAPEADLTDLYLKAMRGGHKAISLRMVERKLRAPVKRFSTGLRMLDVSATDGLYSDYFVDSGLCRAGHAQIIQVGRFSSSPRQPTIDWKLIQTQDFRAYFDILVLDNALHHEVVIQSFELLLAVLKPDALIVVDELFMTESACDLGVDWMTHGGVELMDEESMRNFFSYKGFSMTDVMNDVDNVRSHKVFLLNPNHEKDM